MKLKIMCALLAICILSIVGAAQEEGPVERIPELDEMEIEQGIMLTDLGVKYIVDPEKIVSGGPPMDGIPSIDNPEFVSVAEADDWIADNELVLALIYNDKKRVYPLQIMVWHEIVNEEINGEPILITYCPLCGSGIAYERTIDGEPVEFGTSGKLYNSNLVMYDRKTNSYWTQIDGLAIVGELTGTELTAISIDTVAWRDWKVAHPDSEVLSQNTGFDRRYGTDPYGSYYENSFVFFPVEEEDNRIHPKTVIFGVEIEGVFKAYREDDLVEMGSIEDTVNGTNVLVERDEAGIVTITNTDTGEEIVKERDFWFAWYAFHPDTQVYLPEGEELPPAEETPANATPLGSLLMPLGLLAAFLLVQRSRK
ncbi:hypothetical protein J2755_000839 [Methanohalophilus levihalophilus]|uniref:DUF3179 domain-containing protein n=1 Tax=Methanohalophilus levihalophilus TaxID=1431282 RepID=UPI001AE85B5D|nr:DUF3179 domain-containing protein [Methanohalophilus levihalophilus]MBP2029905.1 hypothetical protein [Methanohalophilus levihalophilus]